LRRRAVPEHRRRDDGPTDGLGGEVRGDLAVGQRSDREVIERPLPADRLVDGRGGEIRLRVGAAFRDLAQEGRVRGVDEAPGDLHLAVAQERDGIGDREDRRGEERIHGTRRPGPPYCT
jgi:hypothetical protein